MFDLGWQEFLMVAVVLMLVVGPKDMPRLLRGFSQFTKKARSMAREFTSTIEEASRQSELKEVASFVKDVKSGNLDEMSNLIDGDVKDISNELKSSTGFDDIADDLKQMSSASNSDGLLDPKPEKIAKKKAKKKAAKKTGAVKKKASKKKQS